MLIKIVKKVLFLFVFVNANAQQFEWATSFGLNRANMPHALTVDSLGNVYMTGRFIFTIDADPGGGVTNITSKGSYDVFIQKLDASGNFVWAKSFGGRKNDEGHSVAVDAFGNVYTTGYFTDTVDFDPGPGIYNLYTTDSFDTDAFIQKLDASGNFAWAKSIGGVRSDEGLSIAVDAFGNIYTTGAYSDTVDFDPGAGTYDLTPAGTWATFLQKLDPSGNFVWAKSFGGNSLGSWSAPDYLNSIKLDASGNIYITGHFNGTPDFDPGVGVTNLTAKGNSVFVQKLDSSGNLVWVKTFGGLGFFFEHGKSIAVDKFGNVFTTGTYASTVDFDPGAGTWNSTTQGGYDVFIHKLDSAGNFVWVKTFGDSQDDRGQSIAVDDLGNVYITGYFNGRVDFEAGSDTLWRTSDGVDDIFVQKLNSSGDLVWLQTYGGRWFDKGLCIFVDASENIYTAGQFTDLVDFNPGTEKHNLHAFIGTSIFVQKMSPCSAITGTDVITACGSYTWIDGNTYFANNNTAIYTLNSAKGCDSVVTLNLTINSALDTTTSATGQAITANNLGAAYQWLDCDNNYAPITGEVNQTFTPSSNGNYAVQLTAFGCVDTSDCVAITGVGVGEIADGIAIAVFPNPTEGHVQIVFEELVQGVELMLTDVQGKLMFRQQYQSLKTTTLNLPEVPGIYFLSIKTAGGQQTMKLVKQ